MENNLKAKNFELEILSSYPNNHVSSHTSKVKTTYGGGFRMLKGSHSKPEYSNRQQIGSEIPSKNFKTIQEEIEELQEKSAALQCKNKKSSQKSFSKKPRFEAFQGEREELVNIRSLEELEFLKEKNAKKLVELEAEYNRNKLEEGNVYKGNKVKKEESSRGVKRIEEKVTQVQKKFEMRFEKYKNEKSEKYYEKAQKSLEKVRESPEKVRKSPEKAWTSPEKQKSLLVKPDQPLEKSLLSKSIEHHHAFNSLDKEKQIMLKWIFRKCDTTKSGQISLSKLLEELEDSPELLDLLKIPSESNLKTLIKSQSISNITFEDFCDILLNNAESKISKTAPNKYCLLDHYYIDIFYDIFKSFGSEIIPKSEFITALTEDSEVSAILSVDALQLDANDTLSLEALLLYIKNDSKSLEITWNQFLRYFFLTQPSSLNPSHLALFNEIFEKIPQNSYGQVSTYDLIEELRGNNEVIYIWNEEVNTMVGTEIIGEVLERIQDEAEGFIDWEGFLTYFSMQNFEKSREDGKNQGKYGTVVEPFGFETREKFKKVSIRERKVKEMVEAKRKEEDWHLNYRVPPKTVPVSVSTPKFEKIIEKQKERSEEIKRTSVEKTKLLEKPFSFYLREQNKVKSPPMQSPRFVFRAKSIPKACTVPLFKSMQEEKENSRKERIASHAQKTLRESSLPPRMKMYEESKNPFTESLKSEEKYQYKAKNPPNFQKLQEKFQKTLEAKKKACKSTKFEPFLIDQREEEIKQRRAKVKAEKAAESSPVKPETKGKFQSKIYLKMKKILEKGTKSPKPLEKSLEKPLEKSYKFDSVPSRLQSLVRASIEKSKETGGDLEEKLRVRKENTKKDQEDYNKKLKEINEKVNKQPLLVETATDPYLKNKARAIVLLRIKRNLEESGVSTEKYFNAEEHKLIDQALQATFK